MSTRTRTHENATLISGAGRVNRDDNDMTVEARESVRTDDESSPLSDLGYNETKKLFEAVAEWLRGMCPIVWKSAASDGSDEFQSSSSSSSSSSSRKISSKRSCGSNECLFAPLRMCNTKYVTNGFCVFHLRAIFNLVYQLNVSYILVNGRMKIHAEPCSFVSDPQPLNNELTAVFPIFEMFSEIPRVEQLKMHHFARYLQNSGTPGWEKIYALHINFLHNLITLRHQKPSSQAEHDLNSTLSIHWNRWNEHQSWLLAKSPANIYIYYATDNGGVQSVPISGFTAITQQICRLFSPPYSSLDDANYYATLPTYGFNIRGHLSYTNNACSSGTITTEKGLQAIGNIATLQYVRTDRNKKSLLHWDSESASADAHCVPARVNLNTSTLNSMSAITTNVIGRVDSATCEEMARKCSTINGMKSET